MKITKQQLARMSFSTHQIINNESIQWENLNEGEKDCWLSLVDDFFYEGYCNSEDEDINKIVERICTQFESWTIFNNNQERIEMCIKKLNSCLLCEFTLIRDTINDCLIILDQAEETDKKLEKFKEYIYGILSDLQDQCMKIDDVNSRFTQIGEE